MEAARKSVVGGQGQANAEVAVLLAARRIGLTSGTCDPKAAAGLNTPPCSGWPTTQGSQKSH